MTVSYEPAATSAPVQPTEIPAAPAAARRRGGLGQIVKLGITLAVSAYVIWQAGLTDALRSLAGADWRFVGLAATSAVVAMVFNVKRWQIMLGGQRGEAPMPTLIRLYLIGMFFNNVLPSRFAGDVVRAYGASIRLTTRTRSAAAVIMDRLVGAISVLLLGVIAVAIKPSVIPKQITEVLIVGLMIGGLVVATLLVRTPWHAQLGALLLRLLGIFERLPLVGRQVGGKVGAAIDAVRVYADAPGLLAWALAISMIANGLSIVNIYLYALAVGADVHIAEAAVVTPVVLAVGLLPISINGIGTIELTFVFLLGLMGVDPQVALAVAILRRLVMLGLSLVGGVLYSVRRFG